jgi:hypothetical protein
LLILFMPFNTYIPGHKERLLDVTRREAMNRISRA